MIPTFGELHPKLFDSGILRFDCPQCGTHKIRIQTGQSASIDPPVWQITGTLLAEATLVPSINSGCPSINSGCAHFLITNGKVIAAVP